MNGLSPSALIMLIVGVVLCYGSIVYFLYRALKARRK